MKKIKSLLSLMLVMMFMLSMAGPMAFADGNNAFTVVATDPMYNPATKQWEAGYSIEDVSGFDPAEYGIVVDVNVVVDGAEVTATPVLKEFFSISDGVDRMDTLSNGQPVILSSSATRSAITVKATTPEYYDGKYISSFELVSGTMHETHSFSGRPTVNVSSDGNTVVADASNVTIINTLAQDVTGKYVITTQNASRDVSASKASVTVKAAAPRLNAEGKWVCDGVETDVVKLTIDGKETYCQIKADGTATDNGTTVTGSLSNVKVYTTNNAGVQVDITDKVNVTTENSSVTKPTLTINVNAPKYDGTKYVQNFYGYKFSVEQFSIGGAMVNTSTISVTVNSGDIVVTDNGSSPTATVSTDKVAVVYNGADVSKGFNIVVNAGVHNKQTIHVYPNPANKDANGNFVHDGFSSNVTDVAPGHWVQVIDWNISSTGAITPLTVKVFDGANGNKDVTAYFHISKHTTNYDGTTITPTTPVVPTNKTKLVIQAIDAEKAYNGYSFSSAQARGVKYAEGTSLLSGHKLNAEILKIQYTRRSDGVTFNDYTDVYKVGTYDKKLIIPANNVILDANNNDVTSQYDITALNGILTIYNAGWVSPDTGDHSNIVLWIVLLAASAVAAAAVVFIVLKKSKKA